MAEIDDRRRLLVQGLVGPDRASLYATSPEFHAAVETLVMMLPAWVEGLAAEAEKFEKTRAEAMGRLMAGLDAPPILTREVL